MRVLITGAAGNLGSFLARSMLGGPHELRLLTHRRPLTYDVSGYPSASTVQGDLGDPRCLPDLCKGVDCIVHFAGVLFAPRPEKFLPHTNTQYVENLVGAAITGGVRKFILISFPHVKGESTPEMPARGARDGNPDSAHARTRLAAEKVLFTLSKATSLQPVVLRAGMIYGRGVLMIEAARWLAQHRLLAVWRRPTWEHLLALPDFLEAAKVAIEREYVSGIYDLADDRPVTLQEFLDTIAAHWGYAKPWRLPEWMFALAGTCVETFALLFGTKAPLTRDFIRIGMASSVARTTRMKQKLLPRLSFPTLSDGLRLL